jgi:hypothetical protein
MTSSSSTSISLKLFNNIIMVCSKAQEMLIFCHLLEVQVLLRPKISQCHTHLYSIRRVLTWNACSNEVMSTNKIRKFKLHLSNIRDRPWMPIRKMAWQKVTMLSPRESRLISTCEKNLKTNHAIWQDLHEAKTDKELMKFFHRLRLHKEHTLRPNQLTGRILKASQVRSCKTVEGNRSKDFKQSSLSHLSHLSQRPSTLQKQSKAISLPWRKTVFPQRIRMRYTLLRITLGKTCQILPRLSPREL